MSSPRRPHDRPNHEGRDRGGSLPSVETLIREGHELAARWGVTLSPSKITRAARDYRRTQPALTFAAYLGRVMAPASVDNRRVIAWADPTGETAVRNVMRERRAGHA